MSAINFDRKTVPSLPKEKRLWRVSIPLIFVLGALLGWHFGAPRIAPRGVESSSGASMEKSNVLEAKYQIASNNGKQMDDARDSRDAGKAAARSDTAQALLDTLQVHDQMNREIRIREIARELSAAEIPGVLEMATKSGRKPLYDILRALGSRWAELDPRAALDFGLKLPSNDAVGFLQGAIEKWANLQPADASSWVASLPPSGMRQRITDTLIGTLSRRDPAAAANLLRLPAFSTYQVESVFSRWAERSPQTAAAAALELSGNNRLNALQGIANAWVKSDRQAALDWVEGMTDVSAKKAVMSAMASSLAEADPQGTIGWARTISDDSVRRDALGKALNQMARTNPDGMRAAILDLPEGDRLRAAQGAIYGMAMSDIRAGISLLDVLPAGTDRDSVAGRLGALWSRSDPRTALNWLTQNVPANDGYALQVALGNWMGVSPQDAIAWSQALPAGPYQEAAMASLVMNFSQFDLSRATSLFDKLSPDAQGRAVSDLAESVWRQDGQSAGAWAESLPAGKVQNQALQRVASLSAQNNPVKTAQWLGTLQPGPGLDAAIHGFADQAFNRDPEGVMAWVVTIGDQTDRERDIEWLVGKWMGDDAGAARAWLQNSPQVTPDLRNRILTR